MGNLAFPHKTLHRDTFVFISYRKVGNIPYDKIFVFVYKFPQTLKIFVLRSVSWSGVRGSKTVTVYSSPQRDAVLRLCGWKGEAVISPHAPSDHLAATARRAAVAIFQVKIFISRLSLENN